MNLRQEVRIKIGQMSIDIFKNQALKDLRDCLFWFVIVPKGIIYQKVLSKIITSSSMKGSFMNDPLTFVKSDRKKKQS